MGNWHKVILIASLAIGCIESNLYSQTNLAGERLMKNPPILAWDGPVDGSVVTNNVFYGKDSGLFVYSGADVQDMGANWPAKLFKVGLGITAKWGFLPYRVEFDSDASLIRLFSIGTQAKYRARVDGEFVSLEALQGPVADGHFYWLRITSADSRMRHYEFDMFGQAFGGVSVENPYTVARSSRALGPRCIVLGDSYTEGLTCYAQRLGDIMGWETWSSGSGGTGYINSGPTGSGRFKFIDRVHSDVIAYNPDIVVVAGGLNDPIADDQGNSIGACAGELYDCLLTNLPKAKVVVVGSWWPSGWPIQLICDRQVQLKAAAESRGLLFIDPILTTNINVGNAGWITGTGNAGNPKGDGNADVYISSDGTHPTDLGHQYLAVKLAEKLRGIMVTDPTPRIELTLNPSLTLYGKLGRKYLIQKSTSLSQQTIWSDCATITLTNYPQVWIDPLTTQSSPTSFYRSLLLP